MKQQLRYPERSKPSERTPTGRLVVPVRSGPAGHTLRVFRTAVGDRTAVAFTSEQRLIAVLGPDHPWIALAEPALRALCEPLGITALTVDPPLAAPAPAPCDPALPRNPEPGSLESRNSEPRNSEPRSLEPRNPEPRDPEIRPRTPASAQRGPSRVV
ncbi:SAV_915 family protein [Kitasatospora griseola]|uniref:SAV_915 family protein n=1 Tax=Kitasatospora griseola TaxID=2064 RepID=UPI003855A66F